jgi:hypothetical protein
MNLKENPAETFVRILPNGKSVAYRKIRLIECNAKCRYLKKLTGKGTLRQVFYLSEAPSPPITPYFLPLTYCLLYVYCYSHRDGEGELILTVERTFRVLCLYSYLAQIYKNSPLTLTHRRYTEAEFVKVKFC